MSARHLPRLTAVAALLALAGVDRGLPVDAGLDRAGDGRHAPQARFDQALHDLLPASVREHGILAVATDASYAPMSSFGPDGRTIVGMEPDLARRARPRARASRCASSTSTSPG